MVDLLHFYFRLLLRRSPVMVAIVLIFVAFAAAYALNQPDRYTANARLLVEPPKIPEELAASTVETQTGEQLQIIQEQMLTRSNLIDIANQYRVFANAEEPMSPNQVANSMREMTSVNVRVGRNSASFMDIAFTTSDGELAAAVVNEYVTRVLQENIRMRTERAGNTLDFFEQEVERLSQELSRQSARISEFKRQNSNSLPEALNFRLSRESTLEERLASLRREQTALEEQRQRVITVFEETGQLRTPENDLTPEQRQLRDLETELSSALAIYSESNPRVTVLKTRIEQLRRVVAGQADTGEAQRPGGSVFDVTIAEIDARSASLSSQMEEVQEELDSLRVMIERTPQTAITLEAFDRDYRNVQSQYNTAVASLSRARTGEQIELTAQGQRISVVENATAPENPSSPNRKLIVATGGFAGVAFAAGLFALLEILDGSVRRPAELVSRVGITPLLTIPYIRTRREQVLRRYMQFGVVLLFFVIAPATLFIVDQYIISLGDLYQATKTTIRTFIG